MARRVIKRNTATASKIITIGYAYSIFEQEKKAKGLVDATLKNYQQSLKYLKEFGGLNDESNITELNKDLLTGWINAMREDEDNPVTTSAINHYLRDCRAFLYWCMSDERQYIPNGFTVDLVSAQEPKPKTYSKEDIAKLLARPKRKNNADFAEWRNWLIANLIMDMGARCGTLIDIQLQDINLQRRTIYQRHTKTKALSHATISTQCAKMLKEYITDWRSDAADTDYLFCSYSNEKLSYNALAHSFTRYCRNRGVEQHSLHGLRHSFATELAENTNGDMMKVQKALGHSSIEMSRKYVNLANVSMGDYDSISPLAARKSNKGTPKRKIQRNTDK